MDALYRFQHGDVETGSSYKLAYEHDREAIPTATSMFSMTPGRVEHSPTSKNARMVQNLA